MRDSLQDLLEDGLDELHLVSTPTQSLKLVELAKLLADWSLHINLTAHRNPESILRNLILDAAALLRALPPFATLADLGSGAGFPGLPIAVLEPQRSIHLVDARERRHHFQRQAIRQLGLQNAQAMRGRIENLDPISCDAVVAQAVGPPSRVLEWIRPWVAPGGFMAIPGGPESFRSFHMEPGPGPGRGQILRYLVPLGGSERSLLLVRP